MGNFRYDFSSGSHREYRRRYRFWLNALLFVVMMMASRLLPQWWSGRICFMRGEPVIRHVRTMVLFISWAVFSGVSVSCSLRRFAGGRPSTRRGSELLRADAPALEL